ncbi:hypothetical protein UXO16_20620 [Enterobacter hormaechei]|uniref:Uncharacterized protein n=1 Tax=Enterobacter ludwigii TaxID=299767 RepID=A0AAX3LJW9_9ENTR|nr:MULTISPECIES: hypothetical protein [Enterobacter cloacae complex]WCE16277.1 hypothetical protein PHA72_28040 [Enterobacter ludwigii]CZY84463.1 Uncharacterised protein [Enterobacter hormaechei]
MTKEYLPHQKRVMDEHEELCGRIKELEAYIAATSLLACCMSTA